MQFVLFALMPLFLFSSIEQNQIEILPLVVVENEKVYLKDVLANKNIPQDLIAKIEKIEIADSPRPGETQDFTNYAISEIVRYNLKRSNQDDLLKDFRIIIPNKIRIKRKTSDITSSEVKNEVMNKLKKECSECEFEIINFRFADLKNLEPGLTWKVSEDQIKYRGHSNFSIDILKNNSLQRRVFAQGNVRVLRNVPVAKRPLSIGSRIQKADFDIVQKDVTFSNELFPKESDLLGSELMVNVGASDSLLQRHLKRKLALEKGNMVQVIIENQGFRIQVSAVAQENGYVGDTVKVKNPATSKIITGVVSDENKVEVSL